MRAGGIRREPEHASEQVSGGIRLARLDVGESKNVPELEIVLSPRARLLEQRERVGKPPREEVTEAEDLNRLAAFERPFRQVLSDTNGASCSIARWWSSA